MPKYPKKLKAVEYFVPGRKRRIAGSTTATGGFLTIIHQDNPTATISQIRELITDETKFIICPEAVAVLDAYIKFGYGDYIPNWS